MPTKFQSQNQKERELGRPRHRWEDNVKTNFKGIG
jgi:hypothetical protein